MYPMESLLDEVRLLWHVMVRTGERLHAGEKTTLGMRGVLELLLRDGPATVPQMARSRRVTRQHVQGLADALRQLEMVALVDNPAHRRSPLVRLTPAGRSAIERMRRRERRLYGRARPAVPGRELRRAAEILGAVRKALSAVRVSPARERAAVSRRRGGRRG